MSLPFDTPALKPLVSVAVAGFLASSYVGVLYLSKSTRLVFVQPTSSDPQQQQRVRYTGEQWRNDPNVIQARLKAVTSSTLFCGCVVVGLVWKAAGGDWKLALKSAARLLGFGLDAQTIQPHLLTPLLYAGPLYAAFLEQTLPFQANWEGLDPVRNWQGIRNYIAGPVTEELTFRSAVLAVLLLGGFNGGRLVFLAPLSFGVAHLHHAWDIYNRFGRNQAALKRAALTTVGQFIYTSLFGAFCTFLYLRTGSVLAPLTSHVFCNVMGLPSPGWASQRYPRRKIAIWGTHLLGIAGFIGTLWRWSEPSNGGRYFWKLGVSSA